MEDGTYCYCNLDSSKEFEDFVEHGQLWQNACKTSGSIDESSDEADSLIFISSIPWVSYTSLIQPVGGKEDSNPRITWGKFFEREKSIFIPVSVLCNHALVDGMHIGMFYSCLDKIIKELINGKNL